MAAARLAALAAAAAPDARPKTCWTASARPAVAGPLLRTTMPGEKRTTERSSETDQAAPTATIWVGVELGWVGLG
jgi:hypothetical protein